MKPSDYLHGLKCVESQVLTIIPWYKDLFYGFQGRQITYIPAVVLTIVQPLYDLHFLIFFYIISENRQPASVIWTVMSENMPLWLAFVSYSPDFTVIRNTI